MPRTQATLQGDDSERFRETCERVGELRGGADPSNAELIRMMMDQFDPNAAVSNPDKRDSNLIP
jgi:hypothetical protein